jgi:hypothetical protein
MKRCAIAGTVFSVLLGGWLVNGRGQEAAGERAKHQVDEPGNVSELMQRKRRLSHDILDAIVLQDFNRIAKDARALVSLSQAAEWRVRRTPRYAQYTTEFQNAAERMIEKARNKRLDGVTLSFTDMTLRCVRCHEYIRETRSAKGRPTLPAPQLAVQAE